MSTVQRTYANTLFYRGTEKTPAAEVIEFFDKTPIQKSSVVDGKKVPSQVEGWKRKDVPIAVAYDVPEGTPDHIILAVERAIHLWAKDIADSYKAVPAALDTASFAEFLTPERGAGSGLDAEFVKAGLAALQQFVLDLTGKAALSESTAYVFKNFFSTKAITSPKGFNVVASQVVTVLHQTTQLLSKFAESEASNNYEPLVDAWSKALLEEITANTAAADTNNLFAL